jgi:hypothetical protein
VVHVCFVADNSPVVVGIRAKNHCQLEFCHVFFPFPIHNHLLFFVLIVNTGKPGRIQQLLQLLLFAEEMDIRSVGHDLRPGFCGHFY